jgi:hypothetical protein
MSAADETGLMMMIVIKNVKDYDDERHQCIFEVWIRLD